MTDIGQDLAKAAQTLADLAKEASYVAIGVGVLGFKRPRSVASKLALRPAGRWRSGPRTSTPRSRR